MTAGGNFWYHAAVLRVQVHARGHDIAQQALAIFYHGGGCLVAASLNA
jgi:hypothetical protein